MPELPRILVPSYCQEGVQSNLALRESCAIIVTSMFHTLLCGVHLGHVNQHSLMCSSLNKQCVAQMSY